VFSTTLYILIYPNRMIKNKQLRSIGHLYLLHKCRGSRSGVGGRQRVPQTISSTTPARMRKRRPDPRSVPRFRCPTQIRPLALVPVGGLVPSQAPPSRCHRSALLFSRLLREVGPTVARGRRGPRLVTVGASLPRRRCPRPRHRSCSSRRWCRLRRRHYSSASTSPHLVPFSQ
jgi:hypothetical protein